MQWSEGGSEAKEDAFLIVSKTIQVTRYTEAETKQMLRQYVMSTA